MQRKPSGSDYTGEALNNQEKRSENSSELKKTKLRKEDIEVITKPICLAPESSPTLGPSQPSHSQQQQLIN